MKLISPVELHTFAGAMIREARSSVAVRANIGFGFAHAYSLLTNEYIFSLSSSNPYVTLMAILGTGRARILGREYSLNDTVEKGLAAGWAIRSVEEYNEDTYIITDEATALVCRTTGECLLIDEPVQVRLLWNKFQEAWDRAGWIDLLYSDPLFTKPLLVPDILIEPSEKWNRLIAQALKNPRVLHALEPSVFEEFVAELLERDGLSVKLTPRTRDGGKDILAYSNTPVGRHLYYVECKRYAPDRPISVSIVRQLYGVVEAERATAGLLVTTSRFTADALAFRESVRHRLTLKDYNALLSWLGEKA